jgi:hypothetical protein
LLLPVHLLSPVSAVSRPTEMPFAERTPQYEAIVHRGLAGTGYPRATLQRPVSWTDQAAHPEQGCFCSCCKGVDGGAMDGAGGAGHVTHLITCQRTP